MAINVYSIPREGRSASEYFAYVTGLPLVFANAEDRTISVDPSSEQVTVDGEITGFTPVQI